MTSADRTEIAGYQVIRKLGAGGMGEVFLVQNPTLPRREALKLLDGGLSRDGDFRARFGREAELLSGLNHPNIVTLYNRGQADESLWLTMEYVDGADCAELLRTHGPMPLEVAAPIISGAAAALDYAFQRRGITHRDVKPANILVTSREGRIDDVKLADFGIAKAAGESTNLTSTGLTIGTMAYISPEAIGDSTNLTGAADQYSLAATAYALLTGAGPFTSVGAPALMYDHLHTPVPAITSRVSSIPRHLDSVFDRALAKSPADRYTTCTEFASALAVSEGSTTVVRSSPRPARTIPRAAGTPAGLGDSDSVAPTVRRPGPESNSNPRRRRWPIVAGSVGVAVIVGATTLLIWRGGGEPSNGPITSVPAAGVIATIPVGDRPDSITIAPDGKSAYVVEVSSGAITSIDTGANKVVGKIDAIGAMAAAVSPTGSALYTVNGSGGTLSIFDTKTKSLTGQITVGKWPSAISVSPSGSVAYVADSQGGIAAIDIAGRRVVPIAVGVRRPYAISASPTGIDIYVTDVDSGKILVIDATTNTVGRSIPVGAWPSALAVDRSGDTVYVANTNDNTVSVVDVRTRTVKATIIVGSGPSSVAIAPNRIVAYVANKDSNSVSVIDVNSGKVSETIPVGRSPRSVAITPESKTAYVTNFNDASVTVIKTGF